MELALIIASVVTSIVSLVVSLRRRHGAREATFNRIVTDACAVAAAKQDGIPREKVALSAAIVADMKDNGKRDFTDGQFLIAIRARLPQ